MTSTPGLAPLIRAGQATLAALLLVTCSTDSPIGLGRPGLATVRIQPRFDASARLAPLTIDRVRVIVIRPQTDTLANLTKAFDANATQVELDAAVLLNDVSEDLLVILDLYAGGVSQPLFHGTRTVTVSAGTRTPPADIPVDYAGPGSTLTALTLAPLDTVVTPGGSFLFRISARDGQGADVPQFYVGWSASGGTITPTGSFTAPQTPGPVTITATVPKTAVLPAGLTAQTTVQVIPAPAGLGMTGGDGQSGLAGTTLPKPLVVTVSGLGNVPVPGAVVSFKATVGGGTVQPASVTTDAAGTAQAYATLGPAPGTNNFTASVADLTVTFTATATGIAVRADPLTAGGLHSCEIRGAATYCWGANSYGQLGDGTNTDRLVATPVSGGQTFVAITAGDYWHSCALTAAGKAFCWGANSSGELGDGNAGTNSSLPVAVGGNHSFAQISAGDEFTCALDTGGAAWCWGSNSSGRLGDGSGQNSAVPVPVAGGQLFVRISSAGEWDGSSAHTCAITAAGAAWCWGTNVVGELGDGTQTPSPVPVAVTGGLSFTDISVGQRSSCAIATGGAGYCWGYAFGATVGSPQPIAGGLQYSSISAGGFHVCGLTSTLGWVCGGTNGNGQLGDGSGLDQQTPLAPAGAHVFTTVAAGLYHSCGVTATQGSFCWGADYRGQLGTGDALLNGRLTPVPVVGPAVSAGVSAGNNQQAAPGAAVQVAPAVLVRDAANRGLPGVEVSFTVTAGGGTLIGGATTETQLTNAAGVATASGWILGPAPASNTLVATVAGGSTVTGNPVSFTALGLIGSNAPLPYRSAGYRYSTDATQTGWWDPAFSDAAWTIGAAPFGNSGSGGCAFYSTAQTSWTTTDLLARKSFTIPAGYTGGATVSVAIDNDIQVFVNGHDITSTAQGAPVSGGFARRGGCAAQGNILFNVVDGALNPGGNNVIAIHAVDGGPPAFLDAEVTLGGLAASGIQWLGKSADWNDQNNWSTGVVPSATDSVDIVAAAFQPVLTGPVNVGAITIAGGTVSPNGHTMTVARTLATSGTGTLTMTSTNDSVVVGGNARFDGGSETSKLTLGVLRVRGNLSQQHSTSTSSFDAGTGVTTVLDGTAAQTVSFADSTTSGLGNLDIRNAGAPVTMAGIAKVRGDLTLIAGAATNATDLSFTGSGLNVLGNVTTAAGSTLRLGRLYVAGNLGVGGTYQVTSIIFTGLDAQVIPAGLPYQYLYTTGDVLAPAGNLVIGTQLAVQGGTLYLANGASDQVTVNGAAFVQAGSLVVNGGTLTVGTNLFVTGSGTLTMTDPNDNDWVTVNGNASFDGGDESLLLTNGEMDIGGNFTQLSTHNNPASFAASGTHVTWLLGSSTLSFATPGTAATQSHFNDLVQNLPGTTITLASAGTLLGWLDGTTAFSGTVQGSNVALTAAGIYDVGASATLNGVRLVIDGNTGGLDSLTNVTFLNLPATATQLTIRQPGLASGPYSVNGVSFVPLTGQATGRYIDAQDADGVTPFALQIQVTNTNVTNGPSFTTSDGVATVVWGQLGPEIRWTGTASTDWSSAANWNTGAVPSTTDSVVIPAGAGNQPSLSQPTQIHALEVASGATLTLNQSLTLDGSVAAPGTITGTGALTLTGSAKTVGGHLGHVTISGTYALADTVIVSDSTNVLLLDGSLKINGQILATLSTLRTAAGGTLVMQDPSDTVILARGAIFGGGDETGLLTAGTLQVVGSFLQGDPQLSFSPQSFVATGNHKTVLVGAIAPSRVAGPGPEPVSFLSPTTSRFQNLEIRSPSGTLWQSNAMVLGALTFAPNASKLLTSTLATTPTLRLANLALSSVIFNNIAVEYDWTLGGTVTQLDDVTFQNDSGAATQLTIIHPGGTPLTFNNLVFSSPPTSGWYLSASDDAPQDGQGLVINVVNPSPTVPGNFVQRLNGAVVNWNATPAALVWTGAVNTDWATPQNWRPALVPGATDSVVIVSTTNLPQLGVQTSVGAVEIRGGSIALNGMTLVVARTLATTGTGVLTMTGSGDQVIVGGDAIFNGGSTEGLLTTGQLRVAGQLTQLATTSPTSFAADAGHQTWLTGATPVVSFATPGLTQSRFGDLRPEVAPLTFNSSVVVTGNFGGSDVWSGNISGTCGSSLTVQGRMDPATLDCMTLVLDYAAGVTLNGLSGVTFLNQDPSWTQLTLHHPGLPAASYALSNITFAPLVAGNTGLYLDVLDVDGPVPDLLRVDVVGNDPGNGAAFTRAAGGAIVSWGTTTGFWTGSISGSFGDIRNWSNFAVPGPTTDVIIPAGTNFAPTLDANRVIHHLTIQPNAALSLGSSSLAVTGSVTSDGTILAFVNGSLILQGTGETLSGQVVANTLITGSYGISGRLDFGPNSVGLTLAVAGGLDLAGHTASVTGNFATTGSGVVQMTSSLDSLLVSGTTVFGGGSTFGLLTSGVLRLGGDLVTSGTSNAAYAPSGIHRTALTSTGGQNVSFGVTGSGAAGSHFQILDLTGASGGVSIAGPVQIDSVLVVPAGASPRTISSTDGSALTARQWQVNSLVVNNLPMILQEGTTPLPQVFNGVTFQNMSTTAGAVQLTVRLAGVAGGAAPRSVTFNATNFTHIPTVGSGALYVDMASTNSTIVGLMLAGSNEGPTAQGNGQGNTQVAAPATVTWQ
jgi:alpha-tubulin suppressor-like RCC1 family protein